MIYLVGNDSEAPDITLGAIPLPGEHLRSHIERRAHSASVHLLLTINTLGISEVPQLDMLPRKHNIRRLEIAMDDTLLDQRTETQTYLLDILIGITLGKFLPLIDQLYRVDVYILQSGPIAVFLDNVRVIGRLLHIDHVHNIRMFQFLMDCAFAL